MKILGYCDSCHNNQAAYHITIQVSIFGSNSIRDKFIQIYLCEACESSSRKMFAVNHRTTLAKALSSFHLFYNEMSPQV